MGDTTYIPWLIDLRFESASGQIVGIEIKATSAITAKTAWHLT